MRTALVIATSLVTAQLLSMREATYASPGTGV
jgi:hypothetical protein